MIPTEFADDLYKELIDMRDTANSLRLKFEIGIKEIVVI
jgi:hypothetical protein